MRLKRFDIGEMCPGFPVDDRLTFRQERCCVVVLVEHLLNVIRVDTDGIRKAYVDIVSPEGRELVKEYEFERVVIIAWPFDFGMYFRAAPVGRSAMLAKAAEGALVALARRRGWAVRPIRELFAAVRAAEYRL